MRNDQKRKKLKQFLIITGLLIFAGILFFLAAELVKQAKLKNFDVKTNNTSCTDKDQIGKYLENSNLNYFTFKEDFFAGDLKKKFYCIGKVVTRISYPDKMSLEAVGREAVFAVSEIDSSVNISPAVLLPEKVIEATPSTKEAEAVKIIDNFLTGLKESSGSAVFLVDKEDVIFEQISGNINFPRLSIFGVKLKIGGKVPDGLVAKIESVNNKLREIGAPTDNILVIGDRLIINSKPRIIFSLKKRLDYQTASLQLILSQAKMNSDPKRSDSGNIESIDLRFDKPVVVYSSKK